jgi:hypothetical protein
MAMKITRIPGGVIKMDLEKLTMIERALKSNFITEVGVLGNKTSRSTAGAVMKAGGHKKTKQPADMTNAEIGLVHEKGSLSRNIPRRSFLLMPLIQKGPALMRVRHTLWNKFLAGDQSKGSLRAAYRDLGIFAENIVQKAFASGGFGKWPKLAPQTIRRKKSSGILIDTAQLRRSIDSRVVER